MVFLSLDEPGGDKHVSLFARNLAGETRFDVCDSAEFGSERSNFDYAVSRVNEALGKSLSPSKFKAFSMLFNQFRWQGTSGWEYWTRSDYVLVLRHALKVAELLKLPLHVHQRVLLKLFDNCGGVNFDYKRAEPVSELNPGEDMRYVNRQIEKGEYYVLVDVVVPDDLQFAVPDFD